MYFVSMKKIITLTAILTSLLFLLVTYLSSCQPDPCVTRKTICKSGGVCKDGDCICDVGYEGDSCQFRVNQKFDSYYAVIRTELITRPNGTTKLDDNDDSLRVKAGNDAQKLIFYSIRDSIFEVIGGSVLGNKLTIPSMTIQDSTYYGDGSLNGEVLNITLFKKWVDTSSKITYVGSKYKN
jgi:hypothetical protein